MSVVFPESHVDLMGDVTFTQKQLINRWDRELLRKWPQSVQDNLRDFMQVKSSLDSENFPNYQENELLLSEFIADKQICYQRRVSDEAKSRLLELVLKYEKEVDEFDYLTIVLNGQDEVLDEEGNIIQNKIEPLQETLVEEGITIENPEYVRVVDRIDELSLSIESVGDEVLELFNLRNAQ